MIRTARAGFRSSAEVPRRTALDRSGRRIAPELLVRNYFRSGAEVVRNYFRSSAEVVLKLCGTTSGELPKWRGSAGGSPRQRRQPHPAGMRRPQVQRPSADHRLGRQRMRRPAGEPHPLAVLPVRLVQVARALVLEGVDQTDLDQPLDARCDLLGRTLAQCVVRRLERHRIGPHHPEVVRRQHVGRPDPERQVRQPRHLRRVAQPRVEQPVRGHGYLLFPAGPLGGSRRHPRSHPAPRSIAVPSPALAPRQHDRSGSHTAHCAQSGRARRTRTFA